MISVADLTKKMVFGAGFVLLYGALIHAGWLLPPEGYPAPVVWFGGGIGLLMLLMSSKDNWPLLAIGWIAAFQLRDTPLPLLNQTLLGVSIAISCYLAVAFLEHFKFNKAITEIRDVILLLIGTGIMAVAVATIGMVARVQSFDVVIPWTLANLAGVTLILPVVLAWKYGDPFGGLRRWLHFGGCIAATVSLSAVAVLYGEQLSLKPFHFFPLLIWAALAFNVQGMAVINLIVGGTTYFATMGFTGEAHTLAVDYARQSIIFSGFTLLIVSSVADHRKENLRLIDREQRLASIVNTADDGIIVVAHDSGLVESMNPAAERMFGYRSGQGAGLLASDVMFPMGRQSLNDAIDQGSPVMARREDGTEFAVQVTRSVWTNNEGKGFSTKIVRDLTASNRAAAELIDREERYRAIVETAVDGIIVIDSHGIIQSFNEAADRMFGFDIGEAIGQPVKILMREEDAVMHDAAVRRHQDTEIKTVLGTGGVEVFARRKDGSVFPAHLAIAEWFVSGERFYTGIMRDLTKQKASEDARDILAREVDHRAKNALAVVQSLVRLTRAQSVHEFIEAVSGRIEALARAHSLLSQTNWTGVPLRQIAQDELAVAAKGSEVIINGDPVRLKPDAVQPVSMLFHELATNAFKYGALRAPDGMVSIDWKIRGDTLVIQWTEEGEKPITAPETSGFGSKMMKQVVSKQLEGSLVYDWRPRGLKATISLPQRTFLRATEIRTAKVPVAPVEPMAGGGRRVLIVEDNALIAMELEDSLDAAGYVVAGRANSVAEAMAVIETTDFDVAVLDVDLGGQQSFPIADTLEAKGIPYAFATGFETLTKERGYTAPVLTKPVNEAALRRAFDELTIGGKKSV